MYSLMYDNTHMLTYTLCIQVDGFQGCQESSQANNIVISATPGTCASQHSAVASKTPVLVAQHELDAAAMITMAPSSCSGASIITSSKDQMHLDHMEQRPNRLVFPLEHPYGTWEKMMLEALPFSTAVIS